MATYPNPCCRCGFCCLSGNGLDDLVDWVTRQKPPALAYIDDRGICFKGDFWATLWQLKRFAPYLQGHNHLLRKGTDNGLYRTSSGDNDRAPGTTSGPREFR